MSGYTNMNEDYWGTQGETPTMQSYYGAEYSNLQAQQLNFQSFADGQDSTMYYNQPLADASLKSSYGNMQTSYSYVPNNSTSHSDFDEPPLLEELEIYPDRILEKTLAVLNPFRGHSLADDSDFLTRDTDLAGPVAFCFMLAMCLFVSGNKAHFGYIYGLSVMSCLMMYCLLTLMTSMNGVFTLASVASILGYCLLPIVGLSVLGVFLTLHGPVGMALAIFAVMWSSLSASRLFVAMSGDSEQRPLIAYPCALVCGVFALLVVF